MLLRSGIFDENGSGNDRASLTFSAYNRESATTSDVLTINDSSVGIGTTLPDKKLAVFSSTANDGIKLVGNGSSSIFLATNLGQGAFNSVTASGDRGLIYGGPSIDNPGGGLVIAPWASVSSGIRLDATGKVGVGTANPSATLDVNGQIRIQGGSPGVGKVLTSDASGIASWTSPVTSSGTGGGAAENPNSGCPNGYILVPGDTSYGTTNFCVMKYEAKFGSKGAESRTAGLPARGAVSQTVAQASCRNLGPGYALINNSEWMTLAANIANVPSNWSGGSVGSGALNRGHSDGTPNNPIAAVTDDNDPCNGTGQACSSTTWHNQRRTHVLSNSNVIWDLAGNLWEWVDYIIYEDKPTPATAAWTEYTGVTGTTAMPKTLLVPSNATKNWWNDSWNGASNGIGQYYAGANSSGGALVRGGNFDVNSVSGVFAVSLAVVPSDMAAHLGFRCVFRPASP